MLLMALLETQWWICVRYKNHPGESRSTWPPFASNRNIWVRAKEKKKKKIAESSSPFLVPHVTAPFPPAKDARLPCNTCWSELLLLGKWDDTLSHAGGWGHFPPIPAAQSWSLPCSIRFKISSALRFSFSLLVRPLTAEMHGSLLIVAHHHAQGKQGWKVG